jgi:hypothetical protein
MVAAGVAQSVCSLTHDGSPGLYSALPPVWDLECFDRLIFVAQSALCKYISRYVCMYVCMCVCIYIYIYIYI